jgi:hypothetical protein
MDGDDSFLVWSSNAFINRKLCIIPSKIGEHTTQDKHDFLLMWSLNNLMIHKHRWLESEIDEWCHVNSYQQSFAALSFKSAYSPSFCFYRCNVVELKDWQGKDWSRYADPWILSSSNSILIYNIYLAICEDNRTNLLWNKC